MSQQRHEQHEPTPSAASLDDLARSQHATPVGDASELAAEIWASDDELDAFLADLRFARNASLA